MILWGWCHIVFIYHWWEWSHDIFLILFQIWI